MAIVYVCIGFMAILFIATVVWAIYLIRKEKNIKQRGNNVKAKVLGYFNQEVKNLVTRPGSIVPRIRIDIYKRMILEFIDDQGKKHIILSKLQDSSVFMKYKTGSTINIFYKELSSDNIIEKIGEKYEDYYDMETVRDEKGIEYKITDDSNKYDIVYLDKKHYSGDKKMYTTVVTCLILALIGGIIVALSYT